MTGPVTVTILSGTDTSISPGSSPLRGATGMYSELVDWWNVYEEPLTSISVRLATIDGGATLEHSEMLTAAQSGDTSYDIYNLDNEWVSEFATAGYIRLLENHLAETGFLAQPLTSGKDASGRLYAAPFTTDVGLLYYRSDLVTDARSLGTFGQVLKAARQVLGDHPGMGVGYAGQFAKYEGLTVNLLEIIRGEDPGAIGKDGAILDPHAVTAALQQLIAGLGGQIPSSEVNGYTESQSYQAFAAGQAVFMRNWPIYYNQLTSPQSGSTTAAKHFGVVPLPFPSVLGGQDLAISTSSPHPAAALQVVKFLTSTQAERCLFAVGGFPATRSSAFADDKQQLPNGYQVAGYPPVIGHPLCGNATGRQLDIGTEIQQGIARSVPRPVMPYYTEFSTILQNQVWPLLNDASQDKPYDVSSTVSALESGVQDALSGHVAPLWRHIASAVRPLVQDFGGLALAMVCQNRPVKLPVDTSAPAPLAPKQHVSGDGVWTIGVSVVYSLTLAAGGGYVFYASIRPVSIPAGYFASLSDFPWTAAYLLLAVGWLLGSVALLILGLAHLHQRARLTWWPAVAWVGTVAAGMAVGAVIMHDFGHLFTAYPQDLDGSPLGPSRFAPGTPYWRALIATGGQLAVGAVMIALIAALSNSDADGSAV